MKVFVGAWLTMERNRSGHIFFMVLPRQPIISLSRAQSKEPSQFSLYCSSSPKGPSSLPPLRDVWIYLVIKKMFTT